MATKQPAPAIPPLVLEWLERLYPNVIPESPETSLRQFCRLQGQQDVLRTLRNELRRQTPGDNVLPF